MVFLSLLINTINQIVCIPVDKIMKARSILEDVLSRQSKKITKKELQKICGFLNFIGCCIVPGRAFTRRLYAYGITKDGIVLKDHHHIRINREMHLNLEMWEQFINHPSIFCRPFLHYDETVTSEELFFYTDASGKYGMGGVCEVNWMIMKWDPIFIKENNPSIQYLEMYALLAAVLAWTHRYKNKNLTIFCDNQNVCRAVRDSSTSCKNCMILIRILVLHCVTLNINLTAKYVKSAKNDLVDTLSRGKIKLFKKLADERKLSFMESSIPVPKALLPMRNLWLK